jgi:hypothetical protein
MVNLALGQFDALLSQSRQEEQPMKSKNPSKQSVRRGGGISSGQPGANVRAITLDFVQHRIEVFNREQGGGVVVRKDRNGYTLVREESAVPIARLRPKDTNGKYEVLYWSPDTDRWRAVGLNGGTILALDEALDFIAADPMDCFWT